MNTNNQYFNQENNQCETGYTGAECTETQTKPIKVTDQQKGLILRSAQVVQLVATSTNQSPSSVTREIKGIDAEVRSSFSYLKQKLDNSIKKHINDMDLAIKQNSVMYDGYGSLSYKSKNFYVVEIVGEGSANPSTDKQSYAPIQPSLDKSLGYEFFMLRLINGFGAKNKEDDKSFNTAPNYKIVFDKESKMPYDKGDVIGCFEYFNGNTEIQAYKTSGNVIQANRDAAIILIQDRKQLENIIKTVFNDYNKQCNDLKSVSEAYKNELSSGICQSIYDHEDQDFFIQFVTCKEVFTLAYNDEYCPTKQFQHTDILDEL